MLVIVLCVCILLSVSVFFRGRVVAARPPRKAGVCLSALWCFTHVPCPVLALFPAHSLRQAYIDYMLEPPAEAQLMILRLLLVSTSRCRVCAAII